MRPESLKANAAASPQGAAMLAALQQLDQSQWWRPEQLLDLQYKLLAPLLRHAARTVPYYTDRFKAAGFDPEATPLTAESLAGIPLLSRRDIQTSGESLLSRQIPSSHGSVHQSSTSGSTGEPVRVHSTSLNAFNWRVLTVREHLWHERDFRGKLAAIRQFGEGVALPPHGSVADAWGSATNTLFDTGPCAMLSILAPVREQADWLVRENPEYLLSYPSNLLALIRHFDDNGLSLPRLRQVSTVSETVPPALREACRQAWGVPVADIYSSKEMGYIACQCPQHEHLHVQAENVLAEVLDADGRPCRPGEVGRLVVTNLYNYAMPLIRYDIGDYVELGEPCACGRGLPVLKRVVGRERNMLRLPNGDVRWPILGRPLAGHMQLPARQYQFIQKSLNLIEIRVAAARRFTAEETAALSAAFNAALAHEFEIRWVYVDAFVRNPSGKFEEFICEIAG